MHRTTLILDDALVAEAMRLTGSDTRTQVVEIALKELVRSRCRQALRQALGTFDLDLTLDELKSLRNAD